jgi:molybdate transport repressor ModE-like protein
MNRPEAERKLAGTQAGNGAMTASAYGRGVSDTILDAGERLAPLDPRQLAALVAIAQTGSFRLAGIRLGYVQSAVSRQIAALEESAGMRLVERERGGGEVRLTHAGEVLCGHAEALLTQQAHARAALGQLARGETGAVRVGVSQGAGHRLLRTAVSAYTRRRPEARVEASEFPSDAPLFDLVERGRIDLGLASLPLEAGPFEQRTLLRVRWVLALPAAWRIPLNDGAARLADLAGRPLIDRHDERAGPSLERELTAAGHAADVVFRTDIDETARELVASGVGAALLPSFRLGGDRAITVALLEEVDLARVLVLVWRRERTLPPAAAEFRDVMSELWGRLEGRPQVRA